MANIFKEYAVNMGIILKNAPIEAHHSIHLIEQYHRSLSRVYSIITNKISDIKPNFALLMSFKVIYDLMGQNNVVSSLIVFGAYPRITRPNASSSSIAVHVKAMKKSIDEFRK